MTAILRNKTDKPVYDPLDHDAKCADKRAKQAVINRDANRILREAGFSIDTGLEIVNRESDKKPVDVEPEERLDLDALELFLEDMHKITNPAALVGLLTPRQARCLISRLGDDFDEDRRDPAELGMSGSNRCC